MSANTVPPISMKHNTNPNMKPIIVIINFAVYAFEDLTCFAEVGDPTVVHRSERSYSWEVSKFESAYYEASKRGNNDSDMKRHA